MRTLTAPTARRNSDGEDIEGWLLNSGVGFGICARQDAQRYHDKLLDEVRYFCRKRGRSWPPAPRADRARYSGWEDRRRG